MRLELLTPQGDLLLSGTYNKLFTIHGVLMVWFFLIPSIPAVLGNFVIPLMTLAEARDVAFPRLNLFELVSFHDRRGAGRSCRDHRRRGHGMDLLHAVQQQYANSHVIEMAAGVFVAGFGSILTGLNFIMTIQKMRAPGMTWFRLPLFLWSLFATSMILVLATPVLAITLALLCVERLWGLGIFDPKLGGDPVLFQHLFWFTRTRRFTHHDSAGGWASSAKSSRVSPANKSLDTISWHFRSIAIAVIGFLVWGHHMFVSSQSVYAGMVFSMLSFIVMLPFRPRSRSSIGRPRCIAVPSRSRRRCFMCWASWDCSLWAASDRSVSRHARHGCARARHTRKTSSRIFITSWSAGW